MIYDLEILCQSIMVVWTIFLSLLVIFLVHQIIQYFNIWQKVPKLKEEIALKKYKKLFDVLDEEDEPTKVIESTMKNELKMFLEEIDA